MQRLLLLALGPRAGSGLVVVVAVAVVAVAAVLAASAVFAAAWDHHQEVELDQVLALAPASFAVAWLSTSRQTVAV